MTDPLNPYHDIDRYLERRLRAQYVSPAPRMFKLPAECPSAVEDALLAAFALFWSDYGACANKLRSALEELMTHFRVKRFAITAKGKRVRIDLHSRIELLRRRFPDIVDHLVAAKWIGNSGVHSDHVTASDIFDAMDLVEFAMHELIERRTHSLRRMSRAINARKGPRKNG